MDADKISKRAKCHPNRHDFDILEDQTLDSSTFERSHVIILPTLTDMGKFHS